MAEKKETKEVKKTKENTVFVGNKGVMAYVLGVMTQFNDGNKEVNIKARGRSISRAVDVAEIVRNRFTKDAKVKSINIGTDKIKTEDGKEMNVSSIEISLAK